MKKSSVILTSIIIILLVGGGLYWWCQKMKPTQGEIDSAAKPVKIVNPNILTNKTTEQIETWKIFGDIPVKFEDNYNHQDLFK